MINIHYTPRGRSLRYLNECTNPYSTEEHFGAKTDFFSIFYSIECGKQLRSHFSDERAWEADTGKHLTARFAPSRPWQLHTCHPCKYLFEISPNPSFHIDSHKQLTDSNSWHSETADSLDQLKKAEIYHWMTTLSFRIILLANSITFLNVIH